MLLSVCNVYLFSLVKSRINLLRLKTVVEVFHLMVFVKKILEQYYSTSVSDILLQYKMKFTCKSLFDESFQNYIGESGLKQDS